MSFGKMTFAKKMLMLTLLTLAASLTAAAQDSAIRFKLAQETRIAGVTLPAGSYRMTLFTAGHPYAIVTSEEGRRSSIMAVAATSDGRCNSSSVTLTPEAEGYSLTSACFAQADTALYFPAVLARKSTVAKAAPSSAWAGAK